MEVAGKNKYIIKGSINGRVKIRPKPSINNWFHVAGKRNINLANTVIQIDNNHITRILCQPAASIL